MNASYAWLKSLVSFDLTPEQVRDVITARCCPVDEVVRLRADLAEVVVGLVREAHRHPESDHLWVTQVDAGNGEVLEVICGAPNVRAGAKYPFARAGTTLPGGLTLERRKIRGVVSNGMLCSARELQLGADHEGILELTTDAPPGTRFLDAVAVGDTRIVVDVTPNRPDLLSHVGLAREIAAATKRPLQLPDLVESSASIPAPRAAPDALNAGGIRVSLEDPQGAPRYMGVTIRGVKVGASPAWMVDRLAAVGSRSVNNIVDITNYLLHELGQPMHAFDAARLAGHTVVVRRARVGETLVTLDGTARTLLPSMTVIADGDRAQALAGIIGGQSSEVTEQTSDVFLEVAHFHPRSVRRTRRALGLSTDASYRFERGTDCDLPPKALHRAVTLILALAGGRVDGTPVDLYPAPRPLAMIALRESRVARLLGERIPAREIVPLLLSVGFGVAEGAHGTLNITVPTWRPDVTREVDLIEEVARLRGYDSFPVELRPFRVGTVPDSPVEIVARRVRAALVSEGLLETRPLPFTRGADGPGLARVANPIAENEAYLRRELLDTLARRAEYNLSLMHRDVRLFEIGSAWQASEAALPREEWRAAALLMGRRRPPHWTEPRTPDFDEWDAKAVAERMTEAAFPATRWTLESTAAGNLLWTVVVDGESRGEVRRVPLDAPPWAAPAFGVELTLMKVSSDYVAPPGSAMHREVERSAYAPTATFRPLPNTPSAFFDVALLVPNDVAAARVEQLMRESAGELLERLELLSEFRGEQIPAGYRSIAWRLTFRHPERTLRDKEIAGRREKLLRTLEGELHVRQRTT